MATLFAVTPLLLGGCEDGLGPEDGVPVGIAFRTPAEPRSVELSAATSADAQNLVITGRNGTLTLTRAMLIVAEFELEGPEACPGRPDDDEDEADELESCEFEALPRLLDLPLAGGDLVISTEFVPTGIYDELEFEVEDLDEDEDDEVFTRQAITDVRAQLLAAFPEFPRDASMVVSGTFTPADGSAARPFTTYFDADIKVEMDLVPPLSVTEGEADRTIVITLDPAFWFSRQGVVLDLSAFDGEMLEFEADIENGFAEVEIEIDD